jgi:glutamate-ammonia-ligase adenylyltransferase
MHEAPAETSSDAAGEAAPAAPAGRSLAERIVAHPVHGDDASARERLEDLRRAAAGTANTARLATLLAEPPVAALLLGLFAGSPYLTSLAERDPERLLHVLESEPEARLAALLGAVRAAARSLATLPELMRELRQMKAEVALLTALADLGGVWPVMSVTRAITAAADAAVAAGIDFLFRAAAARGDWTAPLDAEEPAKRSGLIVLAMGKHGAHELNYSSDIDLIVFFEPALARVKPGLEARALFVRMTKDLVKALQERTGDGYVFRTDLRLRPDPGATQIAISTDAALNYYESVGQNWERAALIKARPIAGDLEAGAGFLAELAPFIWRKYLDFAAITDIHAMKRQIHAFRGFGEIGVAGHNIKVGRGGIREIEFFAQTQQLIAGGRQRDLRVGATLDALRALVARGWLEEPVRVELEEAYGFLRSIEHRLQMTADEQTQTLPEAPEALLRLARFSGFETTEAFAAALTRRLETVQSHYVALFEDASALTAGGANMVFAGEQDDPATVEALRAMGYTRPSEVIAAVRGWHHGRYPAIRTPRARERLTEVQPLLIQELARTRDPDHAFFGFDHFLAELPSGVQLFSLLRANPGLLRLVADIMGSAPRLARILGKRRRVLDAVLDPGFFGTLPTPDTLGRRIREEIALGRDLQERLDQARVVGSEQMFLAGVRVLTGTIAAEQAGGVLALIAERLIEALQDAVVEELSRSHGHVPGGEAAVVAMGKLGGREMTAASDLDLILIYDFAAEAQQSDGAKPLAPSQYFARLTQRLVSALAAPTAEGTLYEVDMRLRPSGQKGPVATHISSFVDYQAREAWTWEHMALTRARVLTGSPALKGRVEGAIREVLVRPRERAAVVADVRDMRRRIWEAKGSEDIWDLKQVRGGLVDVEFIAQFLQLLHAAEHPDVLDQNTVAALEKLSARGLLAPAHAEVLVPAARLYNDLTQLLRLCIDGVFAPATAPDGFKAVLARAGGLPDFPRLEAELRRTLGEVAVLFDEIVV